LWRVSLILVLNRSLLNREYILINILKVLASIISMCNLHETFLSKITPKSKSELCYDRRFSRPVYLGIKHASGA
jgi:hypothetical protein